MRFCTTTYSKKTRLHLNIRKINIKIKNIYFNCVHKHIQLYFHSNLVTNIYNVKGQDTTMHPPILSRYMFNNVYNVMIRLINRGKFSTNDNEYLNLVDGFKGQPLKSPTTPHCLFPT